MLMVYDEALVPLGVVEDVAGLTWARKFCAPGSFSVAAPATPEHIRLLAPHNLVAHHGSNTPGEMCQISAIHLSRDINGMEIIEAQGPALTSWIGRRIIMHPIHTMDGAGHIIRRIVDENVINPADSARRISIQHTQYTMPVRTAFEYASEPFVNALVAIEALAAADDVGFEVVADIAGRRFFFRLFEGADLTIGQTQRNPCVFSADFDNILSQQVEHDTAMLRTTAIVGGEILQDAPRRVVVVGPDAAGLSRREVFISGSDIRQSTRNAAGQVVTITNAQLDARLATRGREQLQNFIETKTMQAMINPRAGVVYGVDYALGDMVSCISASWGVRMDARIVEVRETFGADAPPEFEITFGRGVPSLAGALRAAFAQMD